MKPYLALFLAIGLAALCPAPTPIRADDTRQLSPERLEMVDDLGYFTPGFKQAVHDYVFTKETLKATNAEQAKLAQDLPALQKQATDSQSRMVALRQELLKYEHPEENDFTILQARMSDAGAKLEDQLILAQAYVWTYPASPHEGDAQQYLQQLQKKLADQRQVKKDADAALAAAHAALVRRAQARDLTLAEWRNFLRDMSQDDLVKLLGRPTSQTGDYWIYSGDWTMDPVTKRKVGLQLNFNAGRVLTVDEKPSPP
jgi:hypothetical protein